jgi:ornithine cyclodeaminase/alanine dehydrogenase
MVLLLTDSDVRRSIDVAEAIDSLEAAFMQRADGKTVEGKVDMLLANGWMRLMSCSLQDDDILGYKEFHLTRLPADSEPAAAVRYTVNLFRHSTGELLAVLDGGYLTAIRTGAAAAIAAKSMAPRDRGEVGVIGSGFEARMQLEALAGSLPVTRVRVYSRSAERRRSFAEEAGAALGLPVDPVDRAQEAIPQAGTLIVATNTAGTGPALLGAWLHPGLHVSSIGSTTPQQREIDPEVWRRADRIVLDSHRVLDESGDALAALAAGAIDRARMTELQEVVAGRAPGRENEGEITLYKSIGMGLQDVAVATRAYERARSLGVGAEIPDHQTAKLVEPN